MLKDHINNNGSGIQAIQCDADADYLIAQTAITKSKNNDVVVISADTDILVLLIHGLKDSICKILFTSESVTAKRLVPKVWDIHSTQSSLGPNVCRNMLAIHAFFGCDTVSRIYGFGKGAGLKKFIDNEQFRSYLSLFSNKNMLHSDISSAGEKAIAMLYGGNSSVTLDELRYSVFCTKLSVNTRIVSPEQLPPTTDAAKFHSYRAYHQIQTWMGVNLPPEEWGWMIKGNYLLPKLMDRSPAPATLMKLVRCNCRTGCENNHCSCRKNNLKCTPICGNCKGVSCVNQQECEQSETLE